MKSKIVNSNEKIKCIHCKCLHCGSTQELRFYIVLSLEDKYKRFYIFCSECLADVGMSRLVYVADGIKKFINTVERWERKNPELKKTAEEEYKKLRKKK